MDNLERLTRDTHDASSGAEAKDGKRRLLAMAPTSVSQGLQVHPTPYPSSSLLLSSLELSDMSLTYEPASEPLHSSMK